MRSRIIQTLVAVALVTACGSSGAPAPVATAQQSAAPSVDVSSSASAAAVDLTIFAAASLAGVLEEVKGAYEAAHPGTTLTLSTDSSSALATQIEQGAPADVFLSADTTSPKKLVDGGFSVGEAATFAANRLTVVVPADNPARIASPADLARPGVKIIAAGDEVPITTYAKQLVANFAKEAGYPAGFEAAYAANVVSKEDNVKAVIAKIEIGEGDAAIVYVTDAKASTGVTTVTVPDAANVTARYAGIVVGASPDQEPARMFLGWLTGPDGQAVLSRFGFLPPSA
jgi:molybdate transport system substrate-binding protein